MSNRYFGGVIRKTPLVLDPALGNAANGVFTMDQYMQSIKAGTWPSIDPYFENTTLLLHGNGTNGAQNNTFLDSSTNNFTITRNGNTTQGTFSPFSKVDGRWGNYFDGSGDWLQTPSNSAFALGTGDYTVECWIYATSTPSDVGIYEGRSDGTATNGFTLTAFSGSVIRIYSNGVLVASSGTVYVNQWTHVAVTRASGTTTLWINGVSQGTSSTSYNCTNTDAIVGGGRYTANSSVNTYFPGYISNFRIVKGTAVYTTGFTPPTTPLTAITNTSLLTCQSNRFIDNSSNNFTITANGDTKVTPFSPFPTLTAYDAATNGGSGYFDGSGDYLSMSSNAAFTVGTGAVTIEAWIYCTSLSQAYQGIISGRANNGSTYPGLGIVIDNSKLSFTIMELSSALTDSVNVPLNQWVHIVGVRNSSGNAALFVNGTRKVYQASNTANGTSSAMGLGRYYPADDNYYFSGYISNARIVKGSSAYDPTQTTITVPTSPVTAIANTSLLCNFTNAGILDNSMSNNLETVGNAQIDTTTKKYGTGSMEFDGTGDYLIMKDTPDMAFGSGDFTIEMWLYRNASNVQHDIIAFNPTSTNGAYPALYISSGNALFYYTDGANRITGGTINTGQWYHIALSRSGTSTKLFIDGTQSGSTFTDTYVYLCGANRPVIGSVGFTVSGTFNGFMDDLRITKGVARYTTNFTPQTSQWQDQ